MPSAFDELWHSVAEPVHQAHFGVAIVYQSGSKTEKIEEAIITRERQSRRYNADGGHDVVTTRTARFPTNGRSFNLRGVVTVEEKDYSIDNINVIEGERTEFRLTRTESRELTKPSYRRTN